MDIKKAIKFGFIFIIFLMISISYLNHSLLEKIKDNNDFEDYVISLVSIQENMNQLVLDSMLAKDITSLKDIQNQFTKEKKKFLEIKDKKVESVQILCDNFNSQDINDELEMVYKNEKKIESFFNKSYLLQIKKLNLNKKYSKNYTDEERLQILIQEKIWHSNSLKLIKSFASLDFHRNKVLSQLNDIKYLELWISELDFLEKEMNSKDFERYVEVIKTLLNHTIELNQIEEKEEELGVLIKKLLRKNNKLIDKLEIETEMILENSINKNRAILFIVSLITILFTIYLTLKIYKNVAFSVDEKREKIAEGLREIKNLNEEIATTQREVVFTMGAIGETRSKETGNHVKRVAEYSKLLALYYGLDKEEAEMIKEASPMHDIGKVAIPDSILNKPGKLDTEERKIMETHAQLGYEMLKSSSKPLLKTAAIVSKEHHEKWDGTGYPVGKAKEDIHIYGRITALADVFDALGSHRVYKKAWDDERIFNFFKEQRGKHFDPKLVDIFFDNLDEFLQIRKKFKDL
ncbi:HD-GYP domain-containing protein [Arcobacter sp. LA11]|uniref:HD-GYP domain-containing protein n=1 Tax=Arcobacter sp. LA11 TaxID=1898176 RepID=UPI0009335BCD|nr:HD domain-containing phosphohydrolase [Arcobacter sp. LA11]